jgi:RNA polymerase sigma-70 factor (ECF subfamily)
MGVARTLSPEQLLQDAAWLRGLARTLAHDRDDADDLVQEAWITAWQRQPDASRPMRGWLTKVVRDLAGMKRRSESRRAAREAITDDARAPATPDELLEQMRLHRRLVDLVLELDEPYRSTIIAHFVEGRTSASIARSLGIPAGTVRKRLWEALSRLRAGLDAGSGDRRRWAPAVLAFAKGGMYVAKPTKVLLAVLAALLLTIGATVVMRARPGSHGSTTQPSSTRPATTSLAAPPEAVVSSGMSPADATTAVVSPDARAARRAAMLEAIAKARSHRTAAPVGVTHAASATTGDSTGTVLDIEDKTGDTSDWEKRALGTVNSLFGQCYDLGRAEDPALAGTIMVRFTLVGEPGVGGVLESVEIVDQNTAITQQTFRDCITEQLYALELDPPPDGVTVKRQISLDLSHI